MSKQEKPDYYNESWKILKNLPAAFREAGIPDHEPMPAIADFLILAVLAIAEKGMSEFAANSIIKRQQSLLQDFLEGKPPFFDGDFNGKSDPDTSIH